MSSPSGAAKVKAERRRGSMPSGRAPHSRATASAQAPAALTTARARTCDPSCSTRVHRPWPSPSTSRSAPDSSAPQRSRRSEEHTSELQSQSNLVCRLLLEKKKKRQGELVLHDLTRRDLP